MQQVVPESLVRLYERLTDDDRIMLEAFAETRAFTNPRPQLRKFNLIVGGGLLTDRLKLG